MTDSTMPKTRCAGAIAAAAILVALSATPSLSADPVTKDDAPAPNAVDTGHAGTSERVRQLGAWIDRFFTDENYEAEINKSWLRIRVDSFSELYEGTDVDAKVRLHLKLPSINKRLRFEISSSGEPDDFDGANSDIVGSRPPGAAEEKSSAEIAYVFRALKERSIIARVGWDFDGYDPNPFVGARYRELVSLNDVWNFRFTERVRYYTLDGLESRTTLDLERILEEDTLFRTSVNGTWLEEQPDYFYSLGFALFRPLNESSAVEYQLVNGFRTDPHRLNRVTVRIRHRQKIWRDWLAFEAAPEVSFPDERDFEPVPAILFRLEATFGG